MIRKVLALYESLGELFRLEDNKDGAGKVPGIFLAILEHALPQGLTTVKLAKEVGQLLLGCVLKK